MNLEKFLVIAGVPGVHKLVATRNNGLVIEDRQEGRTRFVPVRQNQITPLGTVAIYTDTEEGTMPIADVFQKMLDQLTSIPPVALTANSAELRNYFNQILPEHDQDRVHINDIKKCIKWFNFMREKGIFEEVKNEPEAPEVENEPESIKTEPQETPAAQGEPEETKHHDTTHLTL